jgi:hypothetical protein
MAVSSPQSPNGSSAPPVIGIGEPQQAALAGNEQSSATPLQRDDWIYRAVVVTLGATVLLVVIGTFLLAALPSLLRLGSLETPPALIALGSAAVGALGGLLAPSPRQ